MFDGAMAVQTVTTKVVPQGTTGLPKECDIKPKAKEEMFSSRDISPTDTLNFTKPVMTEDVSPPNDQNPFIDYKGRGLGNLPIVEDKESPFNAEVKKLLSDKVIELENGLNEAKGKNGWIGSSWDWIKNKTGFGAGSDKVQKEIDDIKKQLDELKNHPEEINSTFEKITGQKLNIDNLEKLKSGEVKLQGTEALQKYQKAQEEAVDRIANIASDGAAFAVYLPAILAAPATGGISVASGLATATTLGALVKTGFKYTDAKTGGREYNTLGQDLLSGAMAGPTAALGVKLAGSVSVIVKLAALGF